MEYGRRGEPIHDLMEVARLRANNTYKTVAHTRFNNGWLVSCVWTAIDYGWGETETPIIFEVAINLGDGWLPQNRFPTEQLAVVYHQKTVKRLVHDFPQEKLSIVESKYVRLI